MAQTTLIVLKEFTPKQRLEIRRCPSFDLHTLALAHAVAQCLRESNSQGGLNRGVLVRARPSQLCFHAPHPSLGVQPDRRQGNASPRQLIFSVRQPDTGQRPASILSRHNEEVRQFPGIGISISLSVRRHADAPASPWATCVRIPQRAAMEEGRRSTPAPGNGPPDIQRPGKESVGTDVVDRNNVRVV
jgi:hypothetical protein